jgi:thiaminase
MPDHHPGTFLANNNLNPTDVPWALTTHLLSVNHEQLLRTIHHPFLARATNGTLPKSFVAHWLANDFQYLAVYKGVSEQTLAIVRRTQQAPTVSDQEDVQTRLAAWLEAAVQNGTREENLFQEVAEMYKFDIRITDATKNEGLRRYEALYKTFTTGTRDVFLPWLEGAVILWAMEKVYYEAWSWAEKQDGQEGPKSYENDQDGGAMRKEFIPNWSDRDFLMFVEQLERIINEGVSTAVKGDEELWRQVKMRTEAVWRAVLDAEEVFWPDVEGSVKN